MKIKSFGCSFIFGSELSDDGRERPYLTPSKFSWPALVAQKLDYSYECFARPGSGNFQILEKVLNQLNHDAESFYIIGWTYIDRFDYNDSVNDRWKTLRPNENGIEEEFYFKHLHSQYRDKFNSLVCIKQAIDSLKQNNCKFLMTYMDHLLFETKYHYSQAIGYLQESIRPYLKNFAGKNFVEWSQQQGFEITGANHPLEPAHAAAAEYIFSHFFE